MLGDKTKEIDGAQRFRWARAELGRGHGPRGQAQAQAQGHRSRT